MDAQRPLGRVMLRWRTAGHVSHILSLEGLSRRRGVCVCIMAGCTAGSTDKTCHLVYICFRAMLVSDISKQDMSCQTTLISHVTLGCKVTHDDILEESFKNREKQLCKMCTSSLPMKEMRVWTVWSNTCMDPKLWSLQNKKGGHHSCEKKIEVLVISCKYLMRTVAWAIAGQVA